MKTDSDNIRPLFDAILRHVPPDSDPESPSGNHHLDYSGFLDPWPRYGKSNRARCSDQGRRLIKKGRINCWASRAAAR